MRLDGRDQAMLAGERGPARRLAMRLIVATGEVSGADRLVDVTRAHVD
ncbi:MAG: aconitase X, partial [Streptosporangiaceae bacterium]